MTREERDARRFTDPMFMFVILFGTFGFYGIPTCFVIGNVIAGELPYKPELWILIIWGGLVTFFGFISIMWYFQAKKLIKEKYNGKAKEV